MVIQYFIISCLPGWACSAKQQEFTHNFTICQNLNVLQGSDLHGKMKLRISLCHVQRRAPFRKFPNSKAASVFILRLKQRDIQS